MNYKNEKKEFVAFVNSGIDVMGEREDICVERVTKHIDEEFLMERASYYLNEIKHDEELIKAFKRLSSICNNKIQKCNNCPVNKYCNTYIDYARNSVKDNDFKMIDLFCGAGGLSLGFSQEGFITCLANDIQECCVDTYAHNHPETPRKQIVLGDIKNIVDKLDDLLKDVKVDIVVGGPPCQGFSMANRQRLIDDPRNQLYKHYVEVVNKVRPKFFVMENVKGMLSVAEQVKEDFNRIGYSVEYRVLNAKDFGIPQNRERLIYIGNCIGKDNNCIFDDILEESKNIEQFVLKDALFGLRKLEALKLKNATEYESYECGYKIEKNICKKTNKYIDFINNGKKISIITNHKSRYNNERDIEIYGRLNEGDRSDDPKIADIMPYTSRNDIFKDKYFKLENNKVCKTITAHMKFDCNMYIHPTQARGLTPREAARVQSYPDDYFFRGSYTKTYMQIGNSVPPVLGRVIARVIKRYIEGENV